MKRTGTMTEKAGMRVPQRRENNTARQEGVVASVVSFRIGNTKMKEIAIAGTTKKRAY